MSIVTDDNENFDTPPPIVLSDSPNTPSDDEWDTDAYVGDDDDLDGADFEDEYEDGPPPLPDNVVDINSGTDADDPDLTGESFGVALTDTDRQVLIEQRGLAPEYLALPHVKPTLRSITSLNQVPSKRRWAFDKDTTATGIAYGWTDPTDLETTVWQLRPDHPRVIEGKPKKYTFRKGIKTPVHLASAPRAFPASGHKVVVVEGTNQSRAVGSALRDDPQFVVIGIAGCQNAMRDGNLQPGIAAVIKNAEEVYLAPDADCATNWNVWHAMETLVKAIRARSRKRSFGKFIRLDGAEARTGMDDYLVTFDDSDRRQAVLDLIDAALPTSCDVPPKKPRGGAEDVFIVSGNIQSQTVTNHIVNNFDLRIDTERDEIWLYDSALGIYQPSRPVGSGKYSSIIGDALDSMLGNDFHVRHIASVEFSVLKRLREMGRTIPSTFGDPQGRIPFANGNYNPVTDELEAFSPDIAFTYRLLVNFNPDAKFVEIPRWLKENTTMPDGNHQLDQLLDIVSGIFDSILGKAPSKAGILHGESRSGKGTLCNDLLTRIVPIDRTAAIGLNELSTENRFAVSSLHGCILSATGELPDAHIKDSSVFKMAMGGDMIYADVKNKKALKFRNRALFIMAGNHPPRLSDSANAARNRMVSVYFPHSHAGAEDLDLVDRLTGEVEGLAYALLQAWRARQARGGRFLDEHPQARDLLSGALNPLTGFVNDCLKIAGADDMNGKTVSPEFHSTRSVLYKVYEAYMTFVGRKGGTLHMDNMIHTIERFGVQGEVRRTDTRARGYSAGINLESDIVQSLLDRDRSLRELVEGRAKPTKFKKTAADTPPPLDEPVAIVSAAKVSGK